MAGDVRKLNQYQLVLALAALAAIAALGFQGTLSGDAVAGMIASIVAFVTGQQFAAQTAVQNGKNGKHKSEQEDVT